NNFLAKQAKVSMALMGASLGVGLYAVHNMIPPHPGPSSAVVTLETDFGSVIIYGLAVAIPTAIFGLIWSRFASKHFVHLKDIQQEVDKEKEIGSFQTDMLPP